MSRLLILLGLILSPVLYGQQSFHIDTLLMGSSFAFTAVIEDTNLAKKALEEALSEVIRIEKLISSWDENSETSAVNRNAGLHPTKVSKELFQLIQRSKKISELSNGYFDISFASIDKVWDFKCTSCELPNEQQIQESIALINYHDIELNEENSSIFLKQKGMKIGFGAIGKGYAADKAKEVMKNLGIPSGVINAGGDLIAWGKRPDGKPWSIGIQDPVEKHNVIMQLPVENQAVVTSGNYERFIEIKGERYCHIIDPKTGWPVKNLQSVTLICPSAELADALATTVFVLGAKEGIQLIDKLTGIECIVVDENGQLHFSTNIKSNYAEISNQK